MDKTGKKTVSLGDIIKANLISSAIINGVKALANGIKNLATAAIGVGSDFESGMSQVAATMGITTEEIAAGSDEFTKLEAAAKDAGATTKFSATQAAEALNYMALPQNPSIGPLSMHFATLDILCVIPTASSLL